MKNRLYSALLTAGLFGFGFGCGAAPTAAVAQSPASAPSAPASGPSKSAQIDYSDWDAVVRGAVKGDKVDYAAVKADARFPKVLATFKAVDVDKLGSRAAKMAFWINSYNAFAIEGVLKHWPGIKSVSEPYPDFGFFKKPLFVVNGKALALNTIENEIIRPTFKDPRVHAALNCASISCPPLLGAAFRPETLDAQLDQVFGAFVNDSKRNRLAASGALEASEIFNWYKADFEAGGGVKAWFVKFHKDAAAAAKIGAITHIAYDWRLNKS